MEWKKLYHTLSFLALTSLSVTAQNGKDYKVLLHSGSFTPEKNITANKQGENLRTAADGSPTFAIIQFESIPNAAEREQLKQEGIELLDYIPNNAYTATLTGKKDKSTLARMRGRAIFELTPEQKMQPALAKGQLPVHAVKMPGTVDVWINYPRSISFQEVSEQLKAKNFEVVSDQYKDYQVIALRIADNRIKELAGQPYIQYVQAAPAADKSFNNRSLVNGRAGLLHSTLPNGRKLTGKGIVVGHGDDSNPLLHIDFNNRIINRAAIEAGQHGVHTMGTMAGAGIMNELYAGYAPKATVVSQSYSNIIAYAPEYVNDFGMVVTNNSYGGEINNCGTYGIYDLYSRILDEQAFQLPNLEHVFSAGNSGGSTCSPYPAGFGNVISGYQTAKNVISVGNTFDTGLLAANSSVGPVRDGRIKPEIVALGSSVRSTIPTNLYTNGSGTSMSSPAVAGGLALLYERFRQMNGGANPRNALMKALIINGATDKGNEGPDYKYGFGWMDLSRSLKMLEDKNYAGGAVGHQETATHNIQVPAGTAQLKVMLYYNDPAATVLSTRNLVNDLDLTLINPANNTVLPRLLDPTPSKVNAVAVTGADHINNVEQVTVNNPAAGTYKISVKGYSVPQNPVQEYYVVYDFVPAATAITYPIGNERLKDGDGIIISWNAGNDAQSTYTVQYSLNDGGSWTNIAVNLAAAVRQTTWTIPAGTTTDKAKIKVVHRKNNNIVGESTSEAFTVVGIPTVTLSSLQCEGYISLDWTIVPGVTDYEVMLLKGDEMVSAGFTTQNKYVFSGMLKDSTYSMSVRARINGHPGRRALAISRRPDNGTCAGLISDNDLKIESILTPAGSGRKNTSSELGNAVFVKIRIKNLDDVDFSGPVEVGYMLDGQAVPLQTITPFIEKGKTYDHTFSIGADMSQVRDYHLQVFIHGQSDLVTSNDTLAKVFRQLPNDQIALPFLDDIENLPIQTWVKNQTGLTGDGRYDFSASTNAGRLRTFVNTGMAASGQRALTLDANRFFTAGNISYLDGTFNLANYNVEDVDVRLNFKYKNHGQKTNANNRVWVRGKDSDPWIEAYDLFANQNSSQEGYKMPQGIELSNLLASNNQNFSSSLQVRWGQWGKIIAADNKTGAGYSFDDIMLYVVTDDIQLLSLVQPAAENCGLGSTEPVILQVRNSSARTITNIPVYLQLNDGTVITDTIASLAKRTTVNYTFKDKLDLSAYGRHKIKVWVGLETDSYRLNDSVNVQVHHAPVISSYPYLENFESNDGHWYTKGTNSSWQHGKPVSKQIKTAPSGTNIWKTNLAGTNNDREESYLHSPCFNVTGLIAPTLSFSVALDMEVCDPLPCDIAYLEYSGDGGAWTRLGAQGQGTNWYNKTYSGKGSWSIQNFVRWHVATIPLPTGFSSLKIRFVFSADNFNNREGIALDDIHIYDQANGIYDETGTGSPVSQSVPASNNWVHFLRNNKLIASVNTKGQNLGNTEVQAYVTTSGIRNTNKNYYLDRNFTIKPQNANLADSAIVRLYFLESETLALVNATGCNNCDKPSSAYELAVSKYKNADLSKEDGNIENSSNGAWAFYPTELVKKVPYDKGYYAELKIKNFSEFWLAKNFVGSGDALPVSLISFSAKKKNADGDKSVLLEWQTTSEEDFDHFDIEVAAGNDAYRQNQFVKLGEMASRGGLNVVRDYTFTDQSSTKTGVLYYRLKMVDSDNSYQYSSVKPVFFDEKPSWQVYPNPSTGMFYVTYQANTGEEVTVNVYDNGGRIYHSSKSAATGFVQKHKLDLTGWEYASGTYLLEVVSGKEKQVFHVLKN
ncbi:S8 family serine peptidase [Dyadobacter psychrophilus]|uniref:Por secretion system C-terminal sorting domain-containing protein n=1 Tax=Dyadobacter psychrophilus TaxID=651661 RepID=A0A1T5GY97_9BACT|nr:S8 family serine peptidase [Dyadobacter psychrophilus]SKC13349.1 Por secretion system C-terminal sorting domain-containing protein [Dyadobacter psychrophilus]